MKNPNIVDARFIEPLNKEGFINEASMKNYFFTSPIVVKIRKNNITAICHCEPVENRDGNLELLVLTYTDEYKEN